MDNVKLNPVSPADNVRTTQRKERSSIDLRGQELYDSNSFVGELKLLRRTLVTLGGLGSEFVELDTFCRHLQFLDWLIEDVDYSSQ